MQLKFLLYSILLLFAFKSNAQTPLFPTALVSDVGSNTIGNANTSRNVAVASNGDIYAVFSGTSGIRVSKSVNRGLSFLPSVQVTTANLEAEIEVADNGNIYVVWGIGTIYFSRSVDNGVTFSTPVTVGFGTNPHIDSYNDSVYIVPQSGNVLYRNTSNGVGAFVGTNLPSSYAFSDIQVRYDGTIFIGTDDPTIRLFKSVNGGRTLVQQTITGNIPSIYYSSYTLSTGSLGDFLFIGGNADNGNLGARIDLNTNVSQSINLFNNNNAMGRTLIADDYGSFVDGYNNSGTLGFRISYNQGTTWEPPVSVARGNSHNLVRNVFYEDIVVVYDSASRVYCKVYDRLLLSISMDAVASHYCVGTTFKIPFKQVGNFPANNIVTAQLSNDQGNFSTFTNLGQIASALGNDTITVTIPNNVVQSSNYRIRLVTSTGPTTKLGTSTIQVDTFVNPSIQISSNVFNDTICEGTIVTFTSNNLGGGTNPTYEWTKNNIPVGGNQNSYTISNVISGDIFRVNMTSNALCRNYDSATSNSIQMGVNPRKTASISQAICQQNLPFNWNGQTVNTVGTFTLIDTTASLVTGCDSITTLSLLVNPTQTTSINQTICQQNLPFIWNGQSINTIGNHTLIDTSASLITGCDSITTLTLTVNPTKAASVNQTICQQNLPFSWNGQMVNTAGTFTLIDTTASLVSGCDSITTLSLVVNPRLTLSLNQTICQQNLPFNWNGQTINAVGTYTLIDTSASLVTNCDSITTLSLVVNPTLTRSISQTICQQNLPFNWNGQTVNTVGTFTLIDTTASLVTGCDSITTLSLLVNPTQTTSINQTICQQSLPFTWNGQSINTIGNHTLIDTSASLITGCDSITTLSLLVNPTKTATVRDTICQENLPYVWNGHNITATGLSTRIFTTPSLMTGCDSITTLLLFVNISPVVNLGADVTHCVNPGWSHVLNGTTANAASYLWNTSATTPSITVTQNGTYILTVTSPRGCVGRDTILANTRMIPQVNLIADTNICDGDTIVLLGTTAGAATYSWSTGATTSNISVWTTNKYKLTVTGTNGCVGSDSTQVTVRPNPEVDLGPDFNACVDNGHLEFINARNPGADYLWDNNYNGQVRVVDASGTYWVQVTNQWNCSTNDTIKVTFKYNPEVDLGNDTNVCEGTALQLNAGNGGLQYYWNTGATTPIITVNNGGVYVATVTGTNGCLTVDSIEVTQNGRAPNHDGIWVRKVGQQTFRFSLLNPSNINSYSWDFGDGSPVSLAAEPVHTFPAVGNYVVRLNTYNSCGGAMDTTTIHIFSATDIADIDKEKHIKLYPNPTTDKITMQSENGIGISQIVVYSAFGQKLDVLNYKRSMKCELDLAHYGATAYFIQIVDEQGYAEMHRVILIK